MSTTTVNSVFGTMSGVRSGLVAFAATVLPGLSFGSPTLIQSAPLARSTLACVPCCPSDSSRRSAPSAFASIHYWDSAAVIEYASRHSRLSLTQLASLKLLIETEFSPKSVRFSVQVDPDEGWEKLVMEVESTYFDLDFQLAKEDVFYGYIDENLNMQAVLRDVVISFV